MSTHERGVRYLGDHQYAFTLWAPLLKQAAVHLATPEDRLIPMTRDERGYWHATVTGIEPGTLYFYQLDGETDRPDPASHRQPQGVHGPSQIVDHGFPWSDAGWRPAPLEQWGAAGTVGDVRTACWRLHRRGYLRCHHPPPAGVARTGSKRSGIDAGGAVSRRPQLGLRRRLSLCGARVLRRSRGFETESRV